jgi:hypothetical protein
MALEEQSMTGRSQIEDIATFAAIYRKEVLTNKTRTVELLGRKCKPRLMRTLLGYELLLSRKRVACPDKITAHYLKIFAELGMKSIEIPYDPTITAEVLPRLKGVFERLKERLNPSAGTARDTRGSTRAYSRIRTELVKSHLEMRETVRKGVTGNGKT